MSLSLEYERGLRRGWGLEIVDMSFEEGQVIWGLSLFKSEIYENY
jgi:hypothetical protein